MIEAGVFDERVGQVELFRGELVGMSPASAEHSDIVSWLTKWSFGAVDTSQIEVRVQSGLKLCEQQSIVEPDLMWLKPGQYRNAHPTASDVLLLVEVSRSSLRYDRGLKSELFAQVGVDEYWIVNCDQRCIEVRTASNGIEYQDTAVFGAGQVVSPQCALSTKLNVSELFPVP